MSTSFTHNVNVNFRKRQFFLHFSGSGFAANMCLYPVTFFITFGRDLHLQGFLRWVQFQWFFDLSLSYQDMATLSSMLTAANMHLYPILVLGSGQATATDKQHVPSPYVTQCPSTLVHTPNVLMYLNTCKV